MDHRILTVRALSLVAGVALAVVATPAGAGFPGNDFLKQSEQAQYRHVCKNAPATQCVDTDDFDALFTGAECVPADPTSCIVDLVPDKQIRGVLTLIADDTVPGDDFSPVRTSAVLEFQIGDQSYFLGDTFSENEQVGAWNPIQSENAIYQVGFGGGALFQGNLSAMRAGIETIAAAQLGVDTNATDPVIIEGLSLSTTPTGTPKTPPAFEAPDEHDADPLGEVARYRVTIRFAKRN